MYISCNNILPLCQHNVVLEIFTMIKYCISAFFNGIQKIVIFNVALANQNHNNQKEWF